MTTDGRVYGRVEASNSSEFEVLLHSMPNVAVDIEVGSNKG